MPTPTTSWTGDRQHLLPIGEYEGIQIVRAPALVSLLEQG